MAKITSDPFLLGTESFVTETDGNTSTVKRIAEGKAITQTEKEIAGDYYNSVLDEIDYAEIYNLKFGSNYIDKLGASDAWMALALTDKTYKEAFKKATGQNSSNISFIAPETSSMYAAVTNNTDANGKSNTNKGGSILRYPLNEDKKQYDYLKICAYEYKPRGFGQKKGQNSLTGDYGTEIGGDRGLQAKQTGSHTVFLPMEPSGLTESNSVGWGNSKLSPIDAALGNISGAAMEGAGDSIDKAVKETMAATGQAFNDAKGTLTQQNITAKLAGMAIGNNDLFTRATGQVMNNNLELLFDGPGALRTFNYNFRFTPRDADEANQIRRIIKFFKYSIAPRRDGQNIFLKSPHVFKLKYIYKNGDQHPFLNKIKTCACTNFTVQYAPDGSYMTYDDGSMTSYNVGMSFGEMNPIYADDNKDENSNDMGY
jgi:hypothetical protein